MPPKESAKGKISDALTLALFFEYTALLKFERVAISVFVRM